MKLRLSIAVQGSIAVAFEHPGPVIRMGREPDCELFLQGEASTGVSRQHARIDLGGSGAKLADLGSSNGTLLNGQLLEQEAPLDVGDRIQLGYTGPTLTVLELYLSPAPATAPAWLSPRILIGAGTALVLVLVVAAALLRPRKPTLEPADTQVAAVSLP